jgi:hypothetical protein
MSMLSNFFVASLLMLLSATSSAQALNSRWHGQWKSSEDSLVITDKAIMIGKERCVWATARPPKIAGCAAFYEGTISKAQLLTQFEAAEKATKNMAKDVNLKQAQKDRIKEAMAKNREVLNALSNDTFKMVHTASEGKEKASGDCVSFYFLDRETVYFSLNCTPAPEAYTVRPYKKVP